ncbi:MAG: sugar-binding domain-containing protein, partial [Bacteroidota bacterium]
MPHNKRIYIITFLLAAFLKVPGQEQLISLAGTWKFSIDRNDVGIKEKWFDQQLNETIQLPGSMLTNNKGDVPTLETKWTGSIYDSSWFFNPRLAKYRQPGNLKFPFWLTPAKYYAGLAWYQKEIMIPAGWANQSIILFLERVHTICTVWVDDIAAGTQNSLATAHEFDLSKFLSVGKHVITLRIDNRIKDMNVGPDSHSVTDHTQGNWNGIIGKIELKKLPLTHLLDVQVYPDIKKKLVLVKLWLAKTGMDKMTVRIGAVSFNTTTKVTVPAISHPLFNKVLTDTNLVEIEVPMGKDPLLWDEFDPALYKMNIRLTDANGKIVQERSVNFGMRKFGIEGTHFVMNEHPIFLRGTVTNCEFPLTGFPPTGIVAWQRIFKIAKAHGLNHMRFHSWCPPEAAFIAADLEGFYLQPEADSWPNHGTSLGDGKFIDKYIYDETTRILKAYGNYASFCMMAACNEPAGNNQAKWLAVFINYFKAKDPRHLYTGASVAMSWPLVPENEYMIKSGARNLSWMNKRPESDSDYRRAIEKFNLPYVTHEQGQWCVFPDFKEIKKYTGAYKAKNFEMFREDLQDQGMGNQAELFLLASGKLQTICYKNEIEKSLRTPGLGGFQLLGLQDFPGQGSAIVGTLNAFWEEKGYTSPATFNRFCGSTVPLIRASKFVYKNNESLKANVEIFHFGKKDLISAIVKCRLTDTNGKLRGEKKLPATTIVVGKNTVIGEIAFDLQHFSKPLQLRLEVSIEGTTIANSWDFWVYPANLPVINKDDIYYTDTLDA